MLKSWTIEWVRQIDPRLNVVSCFEVKKRNYNNIKLNIIAGLCYSALDSSIVRCIVSSSIENRSIRLCEDRFNRHFSKLRYLNQNECINWPIESLGEISNYVLNVKSCALCQCQCSWWPSLWESKLLILSNVIAVTIINGHLSATIAITTSISSNTNAQTWL